MKYIEGLENRRLLSTYVVTSLADGPGVVRQIIPGAFTSTTLRGAITAANANANTDFIVMNPLLRGSVNLTGGELAITNPVTLLGPGANRQSIDGRGLSRVLRTLPIADLGSAATRS